MSAPDKTVKPPESWPGQHPWLTAWIIMSGITAVVQ